MMEEGHPKERTFPDHQVVLSGMSGCFPRAENITKFQDLLLANQDLITVDDERYKAGYRGLPIRKGTIRGLDQFDADFFNVPEKQAGVMDPRLRKLLELTYEAIIDGGKNPECLRGSKMGVFIAAASEESRAFLRHSDNNYVTFGCMNTMLANRISYCFHFQGPSLVLDTACSSGLTAIQVALLHLNQGLCDGAIVASVHLIQDPVMSSRLLESKMLSPEGKSKSFDAQCNGYVRSEAGVALYLCRKGGAQRIQGVFLGARAANDGYKSQGITFPSGARQEELLKEVYADAGVLPGEVSYVEAHGTGTPAGDPEEVAALDRFFCCPQNNREKPLLIGSVKSNMGHSETASGLASIVKVVIAGRVGIIPANLHFQSPNPNIPALAQGRMKVVNTNTPWKGGYVGINGAGLGGTIVHVILHVEIPREECANSDIPWLLPFAGRTAETEERLQRIFKNRRENGSAALLQNIAVGRAPQLNFRGFAFLGDGCEVKDWKWVGGNSPGEIWVIFSGMGTQWKGMGRDLLGLKPFRDVVEMFDNVLGRKGEWRLLRYLCEDDYEEVLPRGMATTVALSAIQLGLCELLKTVGIRPDGIIGHSNGEVACAYADGCYTLEEMIHLIWARAWGLYSQKSPPGAMISVGLTLEQFHARNSHQIFVACHNSWDNLTLSGSPESIRVFHQELQREESIFAREVDSLGFPYHSPLMNYCQDTVRSSINDLDYGERPRTSQWISTSIRDPETQSQLQSHVSTEYFVNNILSPVRFHGALLKIPPGALVLEIGATVGLQGLLHRTLPKSCTILGLQDKKAQDNVRVFLEALGKIYVAGHCPEVSRLYPQFQPPLNSRVSLGTLVTWDHSRSWKVPHHQDLDQASSTFEISPLKEPFYRDVVLDRKNVLPWSGCIMLVWKALGLKLFQNPQPFPVVFENVRYDHPVTFPADGGGLRFSVAILESGNFEIVQLLSGGEKSIVMTGIVRPWTGKGILVPCEEIEENQLYFKLADVYGQLLHRGGWEYFQNFRMISGVTEDLAHAMISWENRNWVSLIETLFQISGFASLTKPRNNFLVHKTCGEVMTPVCLKRLTLHPEDTLKIRDLDRIPVAISSDGRIVQCNGMELDDLRQEKRTIQESIQEEHWWALEKFGAYYDLEGEVTGLADILRFFLQIARDNFWRDISKVHFLYLDWTSDVEDAHNVLKYLGKFLKFDVLEEKQPSQAQVLDGFVYIPGKFFMLAIEYEEEMQDEAAARISPGDASVLGQFYIVAHDDQMDVESLLDIAFGGSGDSSRVKYRVVSARRSNSLKYSLLQRKVIGNDLAPWRVVVDTDFAWVQKAWRSPREEFLRICSPHGDYPSTAVEVARILEAEFQKKVGCDVAIKSKVPLNAGSLNQLRFNVSEGERWGSRFSQILEAKGEVQEEDKSRVHFSPNRCYVLIGPGTDIMLLLVSWMVERGARIFLIVNSSPADVPNLVQFQLEQISYNVPDVTIFISQPDFAQITIAENVLTTAKNLAVVGGIFYFHSSSIQETSPDPPEMFFSKFFIPRNVASIKNSVTKFEFLQDLDNALRRKNQCRHFCVVSLSEPETSLEHPGCILENSFLKDICIERDVLGHPSLYLQVPTSIWRSDVLFRVLDTFFLRPEAIFEFRGPSGQLSSGGNLGQVGSGQVIILPSGLVRVGEILGIQDMSGVSEEKTLGDLGVDSLMAEQLQELLGGKTQAQNEIHSMKLKDLLKQLE